MTTELSIGQRLALSAAVIMAVVLAAYGAIGSYTTIATTAAQVNVPFPNLVPIGIDGGLIGVITLDLILAWTGHPTGWLRQLARLLTIGTVAANVSAGWPNPTAVGLHAAAPVMLLAMVEAGRAVLLRRTGLSRDRISSIRWVLSPWRTWSLWRRMVFWHITSYHEALTMEAHIRHPNQAQPPRQPTHETTPMPSSTESSKSTNTTGPPTTDPPPPTPSANNSTSVPPAPDNSPNCPSYEQSHYQQPTDTNHFSMNDTDTKSSTPHPSSTIC